MQQERLGHCNFCGKETTVYLIGELWACKEVTNPRAPKFTCFHMYEKTLAAPLTFTVKDF